MEHGLCTLDSEESVVIRFIRALCASFCTPIHMHLKHMYLARVSTAYHSIVSICKLQGYSILEYLKKFFEEIAAGNRDYGKLIASTIGISANKL